VAVIGSEFLGGIPFEMVGASPDSVLMKTHPVVYVASLTSQSNAAVSKDRNTRALVVGINSGVLSAPEDEATQVAARLGTSALTGPSATLANVRRKLTGAGLVHLATHGVVDSVNPYRSYLSLADGPLEAWAILHDATSAELIVFSACNTRLGPQRYMTQFTPDESSLSGLALRTGAQRIISSLWAASDQSSQALMDAFYEQWLRDPAQPARALQRAKLAIAPQVGQPMGYANFVLTVRNPGLIRIGQ
jgi:CHAT domain-containing protein